MARILYLIESLGVGGAERGLVLHLTNLDRSRFEPEVAILGDAMTLAGPLEDARIPVHRLHAPAWHSVLAVPRVARMARRFDLVHTSLAWSSLLGGLSGVLARRPVVEQLVNVDPDGRKDATLPTSIRWKSRFVADASAWVGRVAVDRYIAISRATTDLAPHPWMRDPRRVRLIRRGQDISDLDLRAQTEPDPAVEGLGVRPTILCVGRLVPQKGHDVLVSAMPALLSGHPDVQTLFAGDGPLRPQLEQQATALGVEKNVTFLGIRPDIPSLMARADIFAFPSRWEGQGNAVVEAAIIGRPIVTTDIPVMRETFVDGVTARLVPPDDPVTLAAALADMLADPAHARSMGEAASAMARERFDIRATTRDLQAVYEEILR